MVPSNLGTVHYYLLQAVIFLESIFQSEKRIDLLESLVEKFLAAEQTQGELASLSDKEELSSIYLEVMLKESDYGTSLRNILYIHFCEHLF